MSAWMYFDESGLASGYTDASGSFPSPYDAPRAVRIERDPHSGRTQIVFLYVLPDEPVVPAAEARGVCLYVGKDTARLYRLEMNVPSLRPQDCLSRVRDAAAAIDELSHMEKLTRRWENYKLARNVLDVKGSALSDALASSERR